MRTRWECMIRYMSRSGRAMSWRRATHRGLECIGHGPVHWLLPCVGMHGRSCRSPDLARHIRSVADLMFPYLRRLVMTLTLQRPREPANGLTHLVGVALSVPAAIILVSVGAHSGNPRALVGLTLFGISQLAVYTASALYHSLTLPRETEDRLERLDCSMVVVFIAGAYTPVCLLALHGIARWGLLGAVWALALGGVVMMGHWMQAPRWASTALYVTLGWIGVLVAPTLFRALPAAGVAWLLIGGAVYTIGAVIFLLQWPNPIPGVFDAHAVWHLCVLGGSGCIFWLVVRYIAPMA